MAARGKFKEKSWRRSSREPATIDDITVIVIPILPYKKEVCNPQADTSEDNAPDSPEEEVELEVHFDEKKVGQEIDTGSDIIESISNNGEQAVTCDEN